MRFHNIGLTAFASAALLAANPAAAASSSFATLSVSYSLVDLNPLDGIAAAISFSPLSSYDNYAYVYKYSPQDSLRAESAADINLAVGDAQVNTASSVSSNTSLTFDLSASGLATNPTTDSAGGYNTFNSYAGGYRTFSLSANTLVIFSGVSSIGANINNGDFETAYSEATLSVEGYSQVNAQGQSSYAANYLAEKSYAAPSQLQSTTLLVSFANLSSVEATGTLSGQVQACGSTSDITTPVPEPETYAMLLAGLGLMGAMVRRRKQQA